MFAHLFVFVLFFFIRTRIYGLTCIVCVNYVRLRFSVHLSSDFTVNRNWFIWVWNHWSVRTWTCYVSVVSAALRGHHINIRYTVYSQYYNRFEISSTLAASASLCNELKRFVKVIEYYFQIVQNGQAVYKLVASVTYKKYIIRSLHKIEVFDKFNSLYTWTIKTWTCNTWTGSQCG